MMIRIGRKTGGLLAVVAVALAVPVFLPGKAHAISNILPEMSAQGDPSSLLIGRMANGNTMPTARTSAKLVYANVPDQVRVFDGPYCGDSDYDKHTESAADPCDDPDELDGEVYFDFQAMNNDTGATTGPVLRVKGSTMADNGGVNGNYTVNLSGLVGVMRSTDNKYFVKVTVSWARPNDKSCTPDSDLSSKCRSGSNLFRFSIPRTTDYITYATTVADSDALAIETHGPGFEPYADVEFEFAPPCGASDAERLKPLRWRDADYGESNQVGNISWELIDDSAPGGPKVIASRSNSQLGGQNDDLSWPNSSGYQFQDNHKYRWVWYHVDDNNGVEMYFPFDNYNYLRTCPPPIPLTAQCGPMTVTPDKVDPGTPFTVRTSVKYPSLAAATTVRSSPGFRYFIQITGPGGYSYSNPSVSVSPTDPTTFEIVGTVSRPATGTAGKFEVGWGVVSPAAPGGAINCGSAIPTDPNPPSFPVFSYPYFKVNGGDISAGAGMNVGGADCAVDSNPDAGIASWNRGSAGGFGGAGGQYGALALSRLQDFATGQGGSLAPSGLAFSNTSESQINQNAGLFGGKFGGSSCVADYFAEADNVQTGNVTVAGRAVANGTHQTIYVDGNVYITGNITFSGNYANPSEVPSFSVVVRGNIYIAPGVTRLDGFYIAQPPTASSTSGVIYTCATSPFTAASLTPALYSDCNAALTVNGAFAARQVWLLRTAGTLSASTPAETFNYTPELWLSLPFGNGLNPGETDDYDAITSLPPVL